MRGCVPARLDPAGEFAGEDTGCELLGDGSVRIDEEGRTGVPGVFAVGDMARRESSPSGMTFVVTAAAGGFITATAVNQELFTESLD